MELNDIKFIISFASVVGHNRWRKDYYTETTNAVEASIDMDEYHACDDHIGATVEITCGSDPGTDEYQWYIGNNGINYYILSGETSPSIDYPITPNFLTPPYNWFLKCVVTNQYASVTKTAVYPVMHTCPSRLANPNTDNNRHTISSISIHPNPANSTLNLNIEALASTTVEYEIFNLLGIKIHGKKHVDLQQGNNNNLIEAKQLPSGSYYFRITAVDENFNIPFIVNH